MHSFLKLPFLYFAPPGSNITLGEFDEQWSHHRRWGYVRFYLNQISFQNEQSVNFHEVVHNDESFQALCRSIIRNHTAIRLHCHVPAIDAIWMRQMEITDWQKAISFLINRINSAMSKRNDSSKKKKKKKAVDVTIKCAPNPITVFIFKGQQWKKKRGNRKEQ